MEFLMFAASLRKDSCNKKLINVAAQIIEGQKLKIDLADFAEFQAPIYNADDEVSTGIPDGITHFVSRLQRTTALIISSPEYNFSTPGTLKNLIDWVSRVPSNPFKNQPILLMSASPSLVGGNRGLWHTRVPLEYLGAHVYPEMFSLSSAYTAFTDDGQLKDQKLYERLQHNISAFVRYVPEICNLKDR